MNIDELNEATRWDELSYIFVLAKAILLDKVSIINNQIVVEAFTEDE
jgi:hypothetical protein